MGIGALGAGVLGFFGATGAWAAAGGVVAGIVGGAVVGAAIGGLSAAVMGGDVLEGMLFGAVGGAVTGGISAYAAGGSWAGAGASATGNTTSAVSGQVASYTGSSQGIGSITSSTTSTSTFLSGVGSTAKETGQSVTASFLKDSISGYMQSETEKEALAYQRERDAASRQHDLDVIAANAASQRGFDPAGMANVNLREKEFNEQTRQYKQGREDVLEAQSNRGGALAGVLEDEYNPLGSGDAAPNKQMVAEVEKPKVESVAAIKGIEEVVV